MKYQYIIIVILIVINFTGGNSSWKLIKWARYFFGACKSGKGNSY